MEHPPSRPTRIIVFRSCQKIRLAVTVVVSYCQCSLVYICTLTITFPRQAYVGDVIPLERGWLHGSIVIGIFCHLRQLLLVIDYIIGEVKPFHKRFARIQPYLLNTLATFHRLSIDISVKVKGVGGRFVSEADGGIRL